ncbi:coiled-coil domain-containing glutamate-rich protein 1-like [Grus japonensis]|uniref:Coiled-coil domain-containing glutamate-rich protein 1-like n=1 Tax=Grus japonensis TaxID=30415 RepID=A0ABC9XCC5_GRUJA
MRAPRNTNQFLMREKYQLMHLRSDSLGTESGGSDCEMDPLDMDSYLGALENARGALMEFAGETGPAARSPPAPRGTGSSVPAAPPQEESQQYFPSEDDVIESELFMERDFDEFCSRIA